MRRSVVLSLVVAVGLSGVWGCGDSPTQSQERTKSYLERMKNPNSVKKPEPGGAPPIP